MARGGGGEVSPSHLLLLVPLGAALGGTGTAAQPAPPPSIVRIALPAEQDERQPIEVPTEPQNTVEVDFPWPLEDWAGRGFTPDAERFAGDFVIGAVRGKTRIFITPIAAGAHRVLHVVFLQPGRRTRGAPIEFMPAPAGLAWRKVVFTDGGAEAPPPQASVKLEARAPISHLRDPSPESELGFVRTLRLMLNTTSQGAHEIAAANPSLSLASLDGKPRNFGDFTISNRFALRDSTTETLGLCASVANQSARRLLFDPESWVVRAGDRVYPVRTVDFVNELAPGASAVALLVLPRAPGGEPTYLLPDNDFQISVLLGGMADPPPVPAKPIDRPKPQ
jgi:hypothetical protein